MKQRVIFYLFLLLPLIARAQKGDDHNGGDTTANASIKDKDLSNVYVMREPQTAIFSRGGISFVSYGIQLTGLENEILDMEGLECHALLKRDTSALRGIWLRDFTLDDPQNKLIAGQNPLPYYIILSRLVERCTPSGDHVFTSGFEFVQELKTNGQLAPQVKRSFFHTWTNTYGSWRLSTNSHN